ncbi:hypothetical protein ABZ345_25260 [Lentzea sp. NPDC005914]|uniref:hypothetical protein n=1 Tax=Lentzea sp. NPDC005914 TaxID=3154572 RepID=UPI0033E1920D
MIRKSLRIALDTMPEQRQAIADGEATEETFTLLAQRVAVLNALDKSACTLLASIDRQDWPALHDHVLACPTCKPRNPRRLRERVEYLAPGLVPLPEDEDRRWVAFLSGQTRVVSDVVTKPVKALTDLMTKAGPVLADPQVIRVAAAVVGFVVFLLAMPSSAPVSPTSHPSTAEGASPTDVAQVGPAQATGGEVPAPSQGLPAPTSGSSVPGSSQADPSSPQPPQGQSGTSAARYDIRPPDPSAAPCVDDTGRMDPSAPDPAQGSINIDARPLSGRHFVLPSKTGWLDARTVQTLQLAPGGYGFQAGGTAAFSFTVEQNGTISYADELEGFLSGKGTRTLRVEGVVITIDARWLAPGAGVLLSHVPSDSRDWIMCKKVRMVPAKPYYVQQGSGQIVNMSFEVTRDGRVLFDPRLGYARGNGTSTLEFVGYLVHVDARAAGGIGVLVLQVWGLPFSYTKQQTVRLLPTSSHYIQIASGKVTDATFTLQDDGSIVLKHDALALDSEGGVPVVTVTRPLQ